MRTPKLVMKFMFTRDLAVEIISQARKAKKNQRNGFVKTRLRENDRQEGDREDEPGYGQLIGKVHTQSRKSESSVNPKPIMAADFGENGGSVKAQLPILFRGCSVLTPIVGGDFREQAQVFRRNSVTSSCKTWRGAPGARRDDNPKS